MAYKANWGPSPWDMKSYNFVGKYENPINTFHTTDATPPIQALSFSWKFDI